MRIRVEIKGKDQFWGRAFHVEWQHQFADRPLAQDGEGHLFVEPEWMDDLERVAAETFCRVLRAPQNPRRRQWMTLFAGRAKK